jgi:hypothetical protein
MAATPPSPARIKLALEHSCPKCKAPAGIGCASPSGRQVQPHKPRLALVDQLTLDTGPPAVLKTPSGRTLHRSIVTTLQERGDLTPLALALAKRIVRNVEEADNARETAADSPTVIGSTGQEVPHPMWAVCARLEERALADARALMLTADSRVAAPAGGASRGAVGDELDDLDELARRRGGGRTARGSK